MQFQILAVDNHLIEIVQKIQYAKTKSDTIAKLQGLYNVPVEVEKHKAAAQATTTQGNVFGSTAAPTKAKPVNAPEESGKGVKRGRDESDEEMSDDSGAMELSDSD